jgi:putative DNA primase/helicase
MLDFKALNSSLLSNFEGFIHSWFPNAKRNGGEWKLGDISGSAPTKKGSLSINGRTGVWKDFASGEGGSDLISLVASHLGVGMLEAAQRLGGSSLPIVPVPSQPAKADWEPVKCAPKNAPPIDFTHPKFGTPKVTYQYRNADNELVGAVARYETPTGKEIIPYTWCERRKDGTTEVGWRSKAFLKPRCLYGEHLLGAATQNLIFVEGEKCAQALQNLFKHVAILTWPGGAQAHRYADFSRIKNFRVYLWPDADEPGHEAMTAVGEKLVAAGNEVFWFPLNEEWADGYDAADAIADGMTRDEIVHRLTAQKIPFSKPDLAIDFVEDRAEPEIIEPVNEIEEARPPSECPFRILGSDGDRYYYLPLSNRRIVSLTASQHKKLEFLQLAPAWYWESQFPSGGGESIDWFAAANALIQQASLKDFDLSQVRGRGAWFDQGKTVFHAGSHLIVNGQATNFEEHHGEFTYPRAKPLGLELGKALPAVQTRKLLELLACIQFKNPLDHKFLAGWLAVAPICGALEWRPHIWLSGASGTGKSWIVSNLIRPLLGPIALFCQSVSTEAGIRQALGCDALPVCFDEAESERETDHKRMQSVLVLARQASRESDSRIMKGTASGQALSWHVRSCFMFASIGVAATQRADQSRVSILELLPEHQRTVDRWEEMTALWADTVASPEWCAGFRARSLAKASVIQASVAQFKRACMKYLKNHRDADQVAALLAGAYSLHSGDPVGAEAADEFCAAQDWSTCVGDRGLDETACWNHLMEARIEVPADERSPLQRLSVAEVMLKSAEDSYKGAYQQALLRHGIRPSDEGIDIANAHDELRRIFLPTPWNEKWREQLMRLPGARDVKGSRFLGTVRRCVRVSNMFLADSLTSES